MTQIKNRYKTLLAFCLLITGLFGCGKPVINQPDFANFRNLSINAGEIIEAPMVITGEAKGTWFFEGSFPVQIVSDSGEILTQTYATALDDWMTTDFVPFEISINSYQIVEATPSQLFLIKSNPSDLPENGGKIQIPVSLKPAKTISFELHFSNQNFDPNTENCTTTYPVVREMAFNESALENVLNQLFIGPSSQEKDQGYVTSLPSNVKINSIKIENGSAKIDFDDSLAKNAAGSCKVGMMRAQIENTVLAFPQIQNVTISINGNAEAILQP